jgi:hypothetical protein
MPLERWASRYVLRAAGIVSIGAALLAVAGDELSQYSAQGYASLAAVERALPLWRLLTGEMLGVLGIPLCLIGYWSVCRALGWSGVKGARFIFWLSAFCLAMGVVSHAIISSAYTVMQSGSASALTRAANNLQIALYLPGSLFLLSYISISIWYFVAVISGRTLYPRWAAFVSPFLFSLVIVVLFALSLLPVVMDVLYPAWLSFPHLIFFSVSALVLWKADVPDLHLPQPDMAKLPHAAADAI